jgi:hypothetical protein
MSDKKTKLINVKVKLDDKQMGRIPKVFDVIYRIVKTPVCDDDNPDNDETLFTRTLETVEVEGVVGIVTEKGKKLVRINGEFDIPLDETNDDKNSDDNFWANKEDAIAVWEHNTTLEKERAEEKMKKYTSIFNHLKMNLEDRQF